MMTTRLCSIETGLSQGTEILATWRVTVGIKFEGHSPFDLPEAQNVSARPEGEMVEVVLTVSVPDIQPQPVQIRVPFTWKVAQSLGAQLNRASMAAEQQGWKLGHF